MINKLRSTFKKTKYLFLLAQSMENTVMTIGMIRGIFFTSFLLFLGIADGKIAILLSLVGLTQLLQPISAILYHHNKYKKSLILLFRALRTLTVVITPLIPILLDSRHYFFALFIVILLRFTFMNLIGGGGFIEWNDKHVEEENKGKYYGLRNVVGNALFICLNLGLGILIDLYGSSLLFYTVTFIVVALIGIVDYKILDSITYEVDDSLDDIHFMEELRQPFKDKAYVNFLIFTILWSIAISLGRPMLNVYAVKYLHYSYSVVAITASVTAFCKLFSGLWFGNMIDEKGDYFVTKLTGIVFGLSTILYAVMLPDNPFFYIVLVISNGIVMIGFNVSKFRLNMKLSKGPQMNAYLSVNAFVGGLVMFIAINLSGIVVGLLEGMTVNVFMYSLNSYQILFMMSGLMNLLAIVYFVRSFKIKELNYGEA